MSFTTQDPLVKSRREAINLPPIGADSKRKIESFAKASVAPKTVQKTEIDIPSVKSSGGNGSFGSGGFGNINMGNP
jgi:hypothetical protein